MTIPIVYILRGNRKVLKTKCAIIHKNYSFTVRTLKIHLLETIGLAINCTILFAETKTEKEKETQKSMARIQ